MLHNIIKVAVDSEDVVKWIHILAGFGKEITRQFLATFVVNCHKKSFKKKQNVNVTTLASAVTIALVYKSNNIRLLTQHEVKMVGYSPRSFCACLWTEKQSRSINTCVKKMEANI